jgi:predicted HicB family RNase H-like nuclease
MLNYKGYTGSLEINEEAKAWFGRVAGIRDVITFKGETQVEAKQAFQNSIDDYLEFCGELGQLPDTHTSISPC